jgi:hypothetical protein
MPEVDTQGLGYSKYELAVGQPEKDMVTEVLR